ncbi:MAG: flagellar biosynthetic protein FliO [Lachnospiraceae bacterium]|nr:flagellar biosynthetic protein FliO [Lachnospiraceae bacterium]
MLLTASNNVDSYLQFMTVLIIFVFVLVVTYWTTKWIAGYQKGQLRNTNMELIEAIRLTNNKYIQIIRVGQKYLAVAICKDSVTMLTEISEDQLILSDGGEGMERFSFKELLEKVQKKNFSGKEDDRNENE